MARLRCTFIREYEDPGGLIVIPARTVMDVGESRARALANERYVTITPDALYPRAISPGVGMTTMSDGSIGFVGPDGTEYPASYLLGSVAICTIGGIPTRRIRIDSGADATDHAALMYAFNVTADGDPETADEALASAMFYDPEAYPAVMLTAVEGPAAGGEWYYASSAPITKLHLALAGGAAIDSYTTAADAALVDDVMVLCEWPVEDDVAFVVISIGPAYGGDVDTRYREIIVNAYTRG